MAELAQELAVIARLYLDLIRSWDEAGPIRGDLLPVKAYVFSRTHNGHARATPSQAARALQLPRVTVLRRMQDLQKLGLIKRVGKAYVATNKANRLAGQHADMIMSAARKLSKLNGKGESATKGL